MVSQSKKDKAYISERLGKQLVLVWFFLGGRCGGLFFLRLILLFNLCSFDRYFNPLL